MPSHVPNLEAYTKVFIRLACAPFIPVQSLEQLKGQQQLSFRFHQKERSTSTYSFQVKTRITSWVINVHARMSFARTCYMEAK